MSPPARVVWIEILLYFSLLYFAESPPARVVWIEITLDDYISNKARVATREGGVD